MTKKVQSSIIHFVKSKIKQIKELNKIAWWDWTDEEIRDRFEDFYLPIEDILKEYKK